MTLKKIMFVLLISNSLTAPLQLDTGVIVKKTKDHDYSKCFDILVNLGIELGKIVEDLNNKKTSEIIVHIASALKDTYECVECFIHHSPLKIFTFGQDRRQCVLDHMTKAAADLQNIFQDMVNQDQDNLLGHLIDMLNQLRKAASC